MLSDLLSRTARPGGPSGLPALGYGVADACGERLAELAVVFEAETDAVDAIGPAHRRACEQQIDLASEDGLESAASEGIARYLYLREIYYFN